MAPMQLNLTVTARPGTFLRSRDSQLHTMASLTAKTVSLRAAGRVPSARAFRPNVVRAAPSRGSRLVVLVSVLWMGCCSVQSIAVVCFWWPMHAEIVL